MRGIVETGIQSVCEYRGWTLRAIHVRTNHVHAVVSVGNVSPGNAIRDFKAYSTRALRRAKLWQSNHGPWVDGGSKRYLWNEQSLANACDYVMNGQGENLPEYF